MSNFFTKNKTILVILVIVFILSLAYSFYFSIQPSVDARAYHRIAVNLTLGLGYIENSNLTPFTDLAISRMGPGYEFFLAIIYLIFGVHIQLIWVINALLFVTSGFLLYKIALKLFSDQKIAILASVLYLFFIDVFQATAMLLTENLSMFLLILIFYLLVNIKNKLLYQIFFAFVTAVTALVRSTFILTYLIFGIYLFFKKKQYRLIILSFLFIILIFIPWGIRNYNIYNKFMVSNVTLGYNLWAGNNLESKGEQAGTPEIDQYLEEHGIIKGAEHGLVEFKKYVLNHPLHFFKLQVIKTIKYFSLVRVAAFWFHLSGPFKLITALLSGIFVSFIFIFGTLGVYEFIRRKKQKLLTLFIISFPLSVIPFLVENRYRWPIYPFLALAAAYAHFKVRKKEIKFKKLIIFTVIFIIITVIDIIISYEDVIGHLKSF